MTSSEILDNLILDLKEIVAAGHGRTVGALKDDVRVAIVRAQAEQERARLIFGERAAS